MNLMCTLGDSKSTSNFDAMKILHVITGLQKAAGTSVFCGEVCNGLAASGHDVTIAIADPTRADCYPLDPRIRLISISSLLTHPSSPIPHPSIIHLHALWAPVLHKVSNWAHRNKVPVVWSPHGMLTPWAMNNKKWKKRLGWWLYQRKDLARADLLHATAESEVEDIRRMGLKNRVVVAPLGVKLGSLTQRRDAPATKSSGWPRLETEPRSGRKSLRGAEKVLLFVSRVQRKKGLLNLAKAWSILKHQTSNSKLQTSNWRVRIVGPDQEGHTQEVKAECERVGIIDDWKFVGPKYGDELQSEYANADLFVLPTYSENFGSVVIEALAHGVPVITTKGTPWYELEGYTNSKLQTLNSKLKCGWWIDIGVDPLINALQEAISLTDEERQLMGVRGRNLIDEKYTWDAVVKTTEKGYEEVLNGTT